MRMIGARKRGSPPTEGNRFGKVGTQGSVWTVEEIIQPRGLPSHVRLVDACSGRQMTVAASVLADPDRFVSLDKA
jgi:hypothetical protein